MRNSVYIYVHALFVLASWYIPDCLPVACLILVPSGLLHKNNDSCILIKFGSHLVDD